MNWKRITVLSPSLTLTSIVALSSALAKIAQAFPEVSVSAVQTLTTLPSLIAVVVILLSGYLSSWLRKKRIVVISVGLMLAGGLMPLVFHQNFTQLVFAGIVFGLGYGGVSPMTTALIHERSGCHRRDSSNWQGSHHVFLRSGGFYGCCSRCNIAVRRR